MHNNNVYVLGLIGSILGILVSILWFFIGSLFLSGFIAGIMETVTEEYVPLTIGSLIPGILIALFQSGITIIIFIISLMKTIHVYSKGNLKNNGSWLLVLGIISLVINPLQIISSVLLIVAGALAIKESNNDNGEQALNSHYTN